MTLASVLGALAIDCRFPASDDTSQKRAARLLLRQEGMPSRAPVPDYRCLLASCKRGMRLVSMQLAGWEGAVLRAVVSCALLRVCRAVWRDLEGAKDVPIPNGALCISVPLRCERDKLGPISNASCRMPHHAHSLSRPAHRSGSHFNLRKVLSVVG